MKALYFVIAILMMAPMMAFAKRGELVSNRSAILSLCPFKHGQPILLGCADKIQVGKKVYLFDLDDRVSKSMEESFNALIGSYRFHGVRKSEKLDVTGYVTLEKGHFPNPTVRFEVFHIVDIKNLGSIPRPK